ncbi:MAG: conserved phage C-terminal domain-containing protein [Staphylococcus rostri]|uniref:conserved phage C-terminal domain-containing protein n=1 Tax=Staphylococcus rostri TaxID=522262 RepID=UPI0026DEF3E0|nr:conserved phage C-terminal domain-containing protein [Staphylococcus rostri]MDO5375717.1 conserved phage C-terminal domain-containing protein [Staphylococcus rostri]
MATFRIFKESGNFVTVHKEFITDDSLSWKAKGMLLYLLSRPDDWQVYEIELQKHASDGRDSVRSGMKELQDAGYIHRQRIRDKKGQYKEYEYQVYEQPTYVGNNSTNNNLTNNDSNILSGNPTTYPYKDVIDYLNRQAGKQYKSTTKKNRTVIRARTDEGFTLDDFKRVIDNKVSEWKGSNMEKYLRPETLFGTKFEGYLNQEAQSSGISQLERMKYDESYWD